MTRPSVTRLPLKRSFGIAAFLALALAAALCGLLHAQSGKTITILTLDGKTGKPLVPSNLLVRIDHLNAIHNEWLQLNDEGVGTANLPAGASFFSVQGTYHGSMEMYISCDAGMEKDTRTLHWYSVPDILNTGVNAPNECYKGKYADTTHLDPKPGVFVFFVREAGWHDGPMD